MTDSPKDAGFSDSQKAAISAALKDLNETVLGKGEFNVIVGLLANKKTKAISALVECCLLKRISSVRKKEIDRNLLDLNELMSVLNDMLKNQIEVRAFMHDDAYKARIEECRSNPYLRQSLERLVDFISEDAFHHTEEKLKKCSEDIKTLNTGYETLEKCLKKISS
jgi:hypothetical protein